MATGRTTTTQVTDAVNNMLSLPLLERAYPHFVHTLWGSVRPLSRNQSTTIKFRRYTSLSAATTALTEGVTPDATQVAITDLTATPLQYGAYVEATDYLDMTTLDPYKVEIAGLLGDQMGDTFDQLTRDVITAGSTVQYASTATSRVTVAAGMLLTGDEIREAVRTLQGQNAKPITEIVNPSDGFNTSPIQAGYIGIISEDTHFDLKNDPRWTPVAEYAQPESRLGSYEVGSLDEVRFVLAGSNAKVAAAGGAGSIDVHLTVIMGRGYYGITQITGEAVEVITKPLGSGGTSDPLNQIQTMGWKGTFVAKRLNENFVVRVEHAVSS